MTKIKVKYIREEIYKFLEKIREDEVLPFFQNLTFNSTLIDYSRNIHTFKITDAKSLDKVPSQPGFYIIFSDINHENNDCTAIFSDMPEKQIKAIYRGEGYNVQLRLKSHLFNDLYAEDFMKSGLELNKDSNFYKITLSIDGTKVNISLEPFKEFEWYVVYIAAPSSNQNVRNMYEDSFDQIFGQPLYSND